MNVPRGKKRNYEFKIGQIVWAKLKGFPFWPSRVADPEEKKDIKKPKKKKTFLINFFGTNDYSYISTEDMRPYFIYRGKLTPSSKKSNFLQALEEVETYIKDNPNVEQLEDANIKVSTNEMFKRWDKESKDDDVASDFSEEIIENIISPSVKKLKRSHSSSSVPPPVAETTQIVPVFKKAFVSVGIGDTVEKAQSAPAFKKSSKSMRNTPESTETALRASKKASFSIPDTVESVPPASKKPSVSIPEKVESAPRASKKASISVKDTKDPQPIGDVDATEPKPHREASIQSLYEEDSLTGPWPSNRKIGFIATGDTANFLIKDLLKHCRENINVYSKTFELTSIDRYLSQVEKVEKLSDVIERSDIIFSCVTDCEEAREIMFAPGSGILENMGPDKSFVELTPLDLTTTLEINKAIQERNGHYLEAPIFGSIDEARDGKLLFICGGEKTLFDSVRDYLRHMGGHLAYYFGGAGNGTKVRLTLQMFSSCVVAAVAESMALADRSGLNIADFGEILSYFDSDSRVITDAVNRIASERYLPASHRLDSTQKDLEYSITMANDNFSQPTFLGTVSSQVYLMAKKKGHGSHDYSSVFHVYHESGKNKKKSEEEMIYVNI